MRNETAGQLGDAAKVERAMGAARDPNWGEIGIEQKVERVRDALLSLCATAERTTHQATLGLRIAKEHEHGGNGQVVLPVGDDRRGGINEALGYVDFAEGPFRRIQRLLG